MTTNEKTSPGRTGGRPMRRWRRFGIAALVILVLLVVLVTVVPTPVARHLIARQLDALGIEYSGIETVRVNLWEGKAAFGPVVFRTGPGDPGQLADGVLDISYLPLLLRRANAQSIRLIGLQLDAIRHEDGSLEVNGVPLTDLTPAVAAPEDESAAPTTPWGAGLETLALADSRLVLHEGSTRLLELEIELLELTNFFTWTPENPGHFALSAELNDIAVDVEGDATPFADRIAISARSRLTGVTPEKVIRYTGPLGLTRSDGELNLDFQHDIQVSADGTLDGRSVGSIVLAELAGALDEVHRITLADGTLEADVTYARRRDGALRLGGDVSLAGQGGQAQLDAEHDLAFDSLRTSLQGLDAELGADGGLRVGVVPELDVGALRFSGPIRVSVDVVLDLLTILQELAGATAAETGLEAYAGNAAELPDATIEIERVSSRLSAFAFEGAQGRASLELAGSNALENVAIEGSDGAIDVAAFDIDFRELALGLDGGRLTLRFAGDSRLADGVTQTPFGTTLAERIEASLDDLVFETSAGTIGLQVAAQASAAGLSGELRERGGLPATRVAVGEAMVGLAESELTVRPEAGEAGLEARASAGATVAGIEVEVGEDGELASTRVASLALTDLVADATPDVAAGEILIGGLEASLARTLIRSLLEAGEEDAPEATAAAVSEDRAVLQQVQAALDERGYSVGPADGVMGPRTRAAIEAFQRDQELPVDGQVSEALQDALGVSRVPAWARGETLPGPRIRVGRFALVDGGRVRFSDRLVQPAVEVDTVVERLEIRDLDTGDAAARATLDAAAVVNEFTRVAASGWVSGFTASTDLDIEASVLDLELPPFSPYAAEFGGVNVNTGQLSTNVDAEAQDGALAGAVGVEMLNVTFEPLSEEDEARLADTAGMPIRMAVNLLKNPEGQIALDLPISGTVQSPKVEIGSAIRQAVGGVLRRVFPPTAIAGLMRGGKDKGIVFDPLPFAAGTADLLAQARPAAERVASLLAERPALAISVCGRVSAADVTALAGAQAIDSDDQRADGVADAAGGGDASEMPAAEETAMDASGETATPAPAAPGAEERARLDTLATARTRAARRLFIDTFGIDAGRVGECRPVVDPDDPGEPRAAVSL